MKNLQDTVTSVQNAPSSIFTKDDVLNLLNGIEFPKQFSVNPLTQFQIESLVKKITDTIINNAANLSSDHIDYDSAEFTLDYNNTVRLDSVEFETDEIVDVVLSGVEDEITEWFEKAFPESEEEVSEDENE